MLKRILLSGVALTFCAGMAVAQTAAPDQSTPPAAQSGPSGSMGASGAGADGSASATQGQQADASLFTNIKGADVVGSDNKEIGRLADILLDSQGNIQQIVIGSGGIVGVGETLHAYDQASLPKLNGDGKIQLGLTTASLDSLPEYTYPEKVETGRASTGAAGGAASGDMSQNSAADTGMGNPANTAASSASGASGAAGSGGAADTSAANSPASGSSGAMSDSMSNPSTASSDTGSSSSTGSQASADASSGSSSGSSSGGGMLSSGGAGGQMTALSDGNKPGSPEKSDINPVPAEGSASADMSKDAGSSAGESGQSTAANTDTSGSGSAAGSGASGAGSANDQMAANDTSSNASAASGGKTWPASYLVGATITNAKDGAEIGDLHFADNNVDKVIINHGGTLGVGEKQMEVAFNDLQISGDPTDPKVELQGESLQQLNAAAEQDKAKKDMSPPSSSQ